MSKMSLKGLRVFYVDHLFGTLISFWLRFGIDHENGAFFTCFNNAGDILRSKNKYIWSQGRFLWMLPRLLYAFKDYSDEETVAKIQLAADKGADF